MIQRLDVPVSVAANFDHKSRGLDLQKVFWEGREYKIKKLGYHHVFNRGRTLFHVFSVVADTLFFRLVLNTENLTMRVVEVADGETN